MPLPLGHGDHSPCFHVPQSFDDLVTWTCLLIGLGGSLWLAPRTLRCPHLSRTSWPRHDQRGTTSEGSRELLDPECYEDWDWAEGSLGAWHRLGQTPLPLPGVFSAWAATHWLAARFYP